MNARGLKLCLVAFLFLLLHNYFRYEEIIIALSYCGSLSEEFAVIAVILVTGYFEELRMTSQ